VRNPFFGHCERFQTLFSQRECTVLGEPGSTPDLREDPTNAPPHQEGAGGRSGACSAGPRWLSDRGRGDVVDRGQLINPGHRDPGPVQRPGSAEKTVTGDAAAKAQAAAVKSVGGGTAGAVTSDMTGHGFETTVTKANGAKVEVHLDSSYHVMQGPRGPGAPGGHGGPGAPPAAGYGG
jgi:hypothetical protein